MSDYASPATAKWREIIDRQQASGLSVGAFCRRDSIAESSFFAWKRRLGAAPSGPAFVEAKVVQTPAPRPAGGIEVRLRGGRRVRVRRGFDPALLVEVVAALEGLS
jgi:transposase